MQAPERLIRPQAALTFEEVQDGQPRLLGTVGLVEADATLPDPSCSDAATVRVVVRDGGWLKLSALVSAQSQSELDRWLSARVYPSDHRSRRQALHAIWEGLEQMLETLAPRGHPGSVDIEVALQDRRCRVVSKRLHTVEAAAQALVLTIPAHTDQWLASDVMVFELTRLAAHELAHLIQVYPFQREQFTRAEFVQAFGQKSSAGEAMPLVESEAMLVEHCLLGAIAPWNMNNTVGPTVYRDHRDLFARLVPNALLRSGVERHYRIMFETLGRQAFAVPTPQALDRLFPRCAQALRAPDSLGARAPSLRERAAGWVALRRGREAGPPVFFGGVPYGAPRLARGWVLRVIPPPGGSGTASR